MTSITYAGIDKVKEAFRLVKMDAPETVDQWSLEYARDVVQMLNNFEYIYEVNPLIDRKKLFSVLRGMGVYGPVSEMI